MRAEESVHIMLVRMFSGEATHEEQEAIEQWLQESPLNQKKLQDLKEIWLNTGRKIIGHEFNTEKALNSFLEKIKEDRKEKERKLFVRGFLKYASVLLVLISMPFFFFLGSRYSGSNDTYSAVTCDFGDKSSLVLPDGSSVWLNSGSTLRYHDHFSRNREVILEGEAYFSVKKGRKNPFVVKAFETEITVKGTEFNVKAYSEESAVITTLVEGSVIFGDQAQQTEIKPGQQLIYDREKRKMKLYEHSDISEYTEWKDGRLVFRDESLQELELKLERWFDVDILFEDDNVRMQRFTGVLERESILEAVTYFGYSRNVGYRFNGNEIVFYSK